MSMFSIWKRHDANAVAGDGLRVVAGLATDVGQVRSENQDALAAVPEQDPRLIVVCDGMGGHVDGARASRLAIDTIVEAMQSSPASPDSLRQAIEMANSNVWGAANGQDVERRMGTTCTSMLITPSDIVLGHVGDSRAYRITQSGLTQLSVDHTVAAEMEASGMLSREEAERHPHRHALTRALGTAQTVEVAILQLGTPNPDERFLLCSDGLAPVPLEEVWRTANEYEPQEAAEWLITRANALGGPDNITVAVVEIERTT